MKPQPRPSLLAALVLAGILASALPARAADEPPQTSSVFFSLNTATAAPGEKAVLILSVRSLVPLKSVSVSLNFDERQLAVMGVRRILTALDLPAAPPQDIASSIISNLDSEEGNQATEGFIHVEIDTESTERYLGLDAATEVPILEIEFKVRENAAFGFSPVTFETVGGRGAPEDFDNSVEFAAAAPAPAAAVSPDNIRNGGVAVVGEVGFMRGDSSRDHQLDLADPIISLSFLFLGGDSLPCSDAADADDNGVVNITDPVLTLSVLYLGSGTLPPPQAVDRDPTPDNLHCYE